MQKLEEKTWTRPIVNIYELNAVDVITASEGDVLVTNAFDDAEAFKETWYNN